MIYIPVTNLETAISVSEKIYNLSRPTTAKNPDDVSKYCNSWLVHPINNEVVLEFPDVATIPISIEAREDELDGIFEPFVLAGFVPVEEAQIIQEAIMSFKGGVANIVDFIPTFWINLAKTREQLEAEGWFPQQDLI